MPYVITLFLCHKVVHRNLVWHVYETRITNNIYEAKHFCCSFVIFCCYFLYVGWLSLCSLLFKTRIRKYENIRTRAKKLIITHTHIQSHELAIKLVKLLHDWKMTSAMKWLCSGIHLIRNHQHLHGSHENLTVVFVLVYLLCVFFWFL